MHRAGCARARRRRARRPRPAPRARAASARPGLERRQLAHDRGIGRRHLGRGRARRRGRRPRPRRRRDRGGRRAGGGVPIDPDPERGAVEIGPVPRGGATGAVAARAGGGAGAVAATGFARAAIVAGFSPGKRIPPRARSRCTIAIARSEGNPVMSRRSRSEVGAVEARPHEISSTGPRASDRSQGSGSAAAPCPRAPRSRREFRSSHADGSTARRARGQTWLTGRAGTRGSPSARATGSARSQTADCGPSITSPLISSSNT